MGDEKGESGNLLPYYRIRSFSIYVSRKFPFIKGHLKILILPVRRWGGLSFRGWGGNRNILSLSSFPTAPPELFAPGSERASAAQAFPWPHIPNNLRHSSHHFQ